MIDRLLPIDFRYDSLNQILDVEYGDGSVVRYFEIDPRLAFLDSFNERKNRDFFQYLESNRVHTVECLQRRTGGGILPCNCAVSVKSKKIREATNALAEPETRPTLTRQQKQTRLTYPSTPFKSVK